MRAILLVLACLLLAAETQAAALLNVQFGASWNASNAYTGAAVVGTAGDYWNYLSGEGTNPLEDTGGNPTGITLSDSDPSLTSSFGSGFQSTPYVNLMVGYLFNTSGGGSMTIAGLDPYSTFDLYIYTQGDTASDGRAIAVDVNGEGENPTNPTDWTASTFILGQNYLDLAVTADASGELNISYTTLYGEGDINGLQLDQTGSATPEPATLGLLAAGLATLAWRKRRKMTR